MMSNVTRRAWLELAAATPMLVAAMGIDMGIELGIDRAVEQPAQRRTQRTQRTYVLVHAAWHGGWCWVRVADRLRAAGHRVLTPTLTGLGERSHLLRPGITLDVFIEDIVNEIETEEVRDVYLVGHSFSGRTVAGVADRIPDRIRRVVFLDAGLAQNGESVLDTIAPAQREQRIKAALDLDGVKAIAVPKPQVLGVTAPEDVAWLERRLRPQPFSSYESPLRIAHPLGNNLPCTYIRCTEPLFPSVTPSADYAKSRKDWQYLELKTGHDAMVISPGPLAEMLIGLA